MVSGRTAAALGARRVLAQGRRADLETMNSSPLESKNYGHGEKQAEEFIYALAATSGRGGQMYHARLRGRLVLHVEGAPFADQRQSGQIQSQGQAKTRAHRADFRAGT